jgi:hypothetical protein
MTTNQTTVNRNLRDKYIVTICNYLQSLEEKPVAVGSSTIAIPVVDENGDDKWVEISVKIPKGTKDEPYDGYEREKSYILHCDEVSERASKRKEASDKKKVRDAEARRVKAEAKAKAKAEAENGKKEA